MRIRLLAGAAAGLSLALVVALPAGAATPGNASLSVLHGVPDLMVDVYVNGTLTLDNFAPGDVAGPLDLAPGTYTVAITAADAADASAPAIGPVDLPLEADKNYTAVAHLDAAGAPTATLFTNDISTTAPGEGRLTVRHVAAAPAVDVLAGGTAVISGLVNVTGLLMVGLVSSGAMGDVDPNNLKLAVQTISGLHNAPAGVPSGELGLASDSSSSAPWLIGASLLVAAGGALLLTRRTPARVSRD